MSKGLSLDGRVKETGRRTARCPHCGRVGEVLDLRARTGLYFMSMPLVSVHDRKLSFCPGCLQAFEENA